MTDRRIEIVRFRGTETPGAYRLGGFATAPPSLLWGNDPIAFTEKKKAAAPFVKSNPRGATSKEVSTFRRRIGMRLAMRLLKQKMRKVQKAIMVNNKNIRYA